MRMIIQVNVVETRPLTGKAAMLSAISIAPARWLAISVLVASSFVSVAQAQMSVQSACSGDHLWKMTTMVSGMPDGSRKWKMYKHLAMINTAMAQDGVRGCEKVMRTMHRRQKNMGHMKSGKMM